MRVLLSLAALACSIALPLSAADSIGGQGPARAARSVHLKWKADECEAFYLEAAVEQTTRGSYFMACGWSGGYFGIQEVNDGKKVAIFSVWDPTKGDDPKVVKPEERVELLHEGEGVRIKRFGGEGTGGQCMADFSWAIGETVRFLVRAEVQGEKTAYAGWIFDPRAKAWRHLVTFRTRTGGKQLRGLYSFVEDFRRDGRSVDEVRRARFFHGWTKPAGGEWLALTQANFTASRADWEARDPINAGIAEDGFYLATGGDTRRAAELNAPIGSVPPPKTLPADLPVEVWASSAGATPR
jgi:hypothetical protein